MTCRVTTHDKSRNQSKSRSTNSESSRGRLLAGVPSSCRSCSLLPEVVEVEVVEEVLVEVEGAGGAEGEVEEVEVPGVGAA